MHKNLIFLFCLLGFTNPGLRSESIDSSPEAREKQPFEHFINHGEEIFKSSNEEPIKNTVEKTQNRHVPGQIDEWRTRIYPGKSIKAYWISATNRELSRQVRLWDKKDLLPLGVKIGDAKEAVVEKLGDPTERKDNTLIYYVKEAGFRNSATLVFSRGRLKEVVWDYELD